MTVRQILTEYLVSHDCNGLYNDELGSEPYGFGLDALQACDNWCMNCMAARRGEDGLYYPVDIENG